MSNSTLAYVEEKLIVTTTAYAVSRVLRVRDGHRFAKKQLTSNKASDLPRFLTEARVLARLNHPNIIKVVDQQLNSAPYFVIMPLYEMNLREWLNAQKGRERPADADVKEIFERLLDAIIYAHDQGVIHRDLKPENILLNSPRDLVVIDFNISVDLLHEPGRLTKSGQKLGTPLYAAPEQVRDARAVDERADIYSLGVVLHEMCGGLIGSSTLDIRPLPTFARWIVEKCTNGDPENRFSNVRELKKAWLVAKDLNTKDSEINEIETYMLAPGDSCHGRAHRILDLLETHSDDVDLLDKFFMGVQPAPFKALSQENPFRLDSVVRFWTQFYSKRPWPFEYTDEIARRVEVLSTQVGSDYIKVDLIISLIILGNFHNRYFVWRVAAQLIKNLKTSAEISELIDRLSPMEGELDRVAEYLSPSQVHHDLHSVLFQNFSEEHLAFRSTPGRVDQA